MLEEEDARYQRDMRAGPEWWPVTGELGRGKRGDTAGLGRCEQSTEEQGKVCHPDGWRRAPGAKALGWLGGAELDQNRGNV